MRRWMPMGSLALFLLGLLAAGCQAPRPAASHPAGAPPTGNSSSRHFPLVVTDDAGRRVVIPKVPERIVSLAASSTEILYALGLGPQVVGVDQYSNYPPEARTKPCVGSFSGPDMEQIVASAPDLVLADGIQDSATIAALAARRLAVLVVAPKDLPGVLERIVLIGRITGRETQAERLVAALQKRMDSVVARVRNGKRPRVFFELSPDLFTAGPGSFVNDLIERAGGESIAAGAPGPWPQLSEETLLLKDPEVILLADRAGGATVENVCVRPGWQQVSAVRSRRVVAIDSDVTNRPGPRVVEGLEAIARAIHPERGL